MKTDNRGRCLPARKPHEWTLPCFGILPLLLALALATLPLHASPTSPSYARDYWGISDGLPTPGTTAVAQDHQGYLWFGSLFGLSRFDGSRFINFYPSNTPQLPSAWITALQADHQGRLWIGTARGLVVYQHGRFQHAQGSQSGTELGEIRTLTLDRQDRLLIGSNQGVHRLEADGTIRLLAAIGPVDALTDSDQGLWAGEGDSVQQLQGQGQRHHPLPPVTGQRLTALTEVAGVLWAGTSIGLYRFDGQHWQPSTDARLAGTTTYRNLFADGDGSLWIIEPSRLLHLRDGQLIEEIELTPAFPHARYALRDRDGSLWLTSTRAGVMRLWPAVARYYPLQGNPASPLIWATLQLRDGQIVAGGMRGLSILRNNQLEPLLPGQEALNIYTLMAEQDQLWLGTVDGAQLYRHGQLLHPPALAPLRGIRVNGLLRDAAQSLWLATNNGLYRLRSDGQLHHFVLPPGTTDGPLRVLLARHQGDLLVGGEPGLFRIDGDHLASIPLPAVDPTVHALHELRGGQLLVGTASYEGLHLLMDGRWHSIDSQQGLPSHHTPYAITDDAHGSVLVSGFLGVYRVAEAELLKAARDPSAKADAQMLLTQSDRLHPGQRGHCCNGGGMARGFIDDGSFWVPASEGIYRIDIGARHPPLRSPTAVIEQVRVEGQWRPAEDRDWSLPATARDLMFDFNVLDFDPLHSPQLRYRLLGYDQHWHTLGHQVERNAQYTNLPGGDYRFQVQALDENQTPLSSAELSLRINPYFHETWRFQLLLVAAALLAIALLARAMSLWQARRRKILQRLVEQRTQELHDANRQLDSISRTDPLTGLYNRRHVVQQIAAELASAQTRAWSAEVPTLSLLALVDIDHFKAINDTWGHAAGDDVLREISRRLTTQMRSSDYVTRWGGEEFLVVLHDLPAQQRDIVADRLCACIRAQPVLVGGRPHTLSVSIGLVEFPVFTAAPDALDWQQALWLADMAMYAAKRAGRDGWARYQPDDSDRLPPDNATPQTLINDGLLVLKHSLPQ